MASEQEVKRQIDADMEALIEDEFKSYFIVHDPYLPYLSKDISHIVHISNWSYKWMHRVLTHLDVYYMTMH